MTDKLITHEDFELALDSYIGLVEVVFPKNNNRAHLTRIETMKNYAKQQEQFVKDVSRYFELRELQTDEAMFPTEYLFTDDDWRELYYLEEKLSKVGKTNE